MKFTKSLIQKSPNLESDFLHALWKVFNNTRKHIIHCLANPSRGKQPRRHFSTQQQFSMDQRIQNKLTNSILRKWRKQKSFIRFLDGDTRNCRVDNLAYVSLEDAMNHIEAWRVDWDMNLSRAEVALVFDDVWRAGLRF